jgi:hypothetical protein
MRRAMALFLVVSLAVVHTTTPAQALVFSMWQDLFPSGTNEPGLLLLTGVTLLSLSQLGRRPD